MSNTDSFIDEVTEEVRRDQLYGYARRYGWIAIVVILGIVGFTVWTEVSKSRAETQARANGDAFIAALELEDAAERRAALDALALTGDAAILARFAQAAEAVRAEDKAAALAIYDEIASAQTRPLFQDLAKLRALILRGDTLPITERRAALAPLAVAGAAFRPLAQEQLAIAAMADGDTAAAIEIFATLMQDSQSPQSLRNRAQQMIIALGGELPEGANLLLGQ